MIIKKDFEIVKEKVERKSIALKAKKESSDEECSTFGSEDEEYAIEVRDFKKFFKRRCRFVRQPRINKKTFRRSRDVKNGKSDRKCFRCGDPNPLIGECLKPPKDKNQRAFVGGSWSDRDEEDDEKVKDETCLVAHASSEVCFESSYISDEKSSIDDLALDNEYDKLCKMSLKISTKNKRLKATRNSLENKLRELKDKLSILEKNKGVDLDCAKCHALKIENEKLKEESTRLNKFEKSTHCLNEMLSNQKPSGDKLGKQAHASHKAKNVVSTTRCLELLHMHLFGPSDVWSYEGNRYTLVIVDDYSRYTWTRFLKDKTEAFDQVEIFSRKIQNQLGYSQNSKAYIVLNKHTKKVKESLNVTFDETPPPSKTSPLVDDNLDEEEVIKFIEKKNLENDIVDETLEIDKRVNIKESRNHLLENIIGNLNKRTLRNKLDENGIVSRNKARLVAQGYNQQEGIDYDETYASIAKHMCDEFAKIMYDEFEMSMMGELNFFLGLQIKQMEDGVFFNQSKYIKEMLKKFGLEDSKPMKTPMSSDTKLLKDEECELVDCTKYRGMI
nr:zf-CCHC domain-containing protein/DUF4219 domain-containing protein/UBN2 domain-containing protein [Tanacetum cinerariifolium]